MLRGNRWPKNEVGTFLGAEEGIGEVPWGLKWHDGSIRAVSLFVGRTSADSRRLYTEATIEHKLQRSRVLGNRGRGLNVRGCV